VNWKMWIEKAYVYTKRLWLIKNGLKIQLGRIMGILGILGRRMCYQIAEKAVDLTG
jgi:hypothetical protein